MAMGRRAAHQKKVAAEELNRVKESVLQRKEKIKLSQEAELRPTKAVSNSADLSVAATATTSTISSSRRSKEESIRYIAALEDRLRSKAQAKNIQVPSLCNCEHGKSYLSTKPVWERCAKDCVFHEKPQAYARALGDIFRTLDN